jgi:23S rRNA (cytidine1920-2'-O)/16S rRNA (cytidine1409-2'-O)-methyltransferase
MARLVRAIPVSLRGEDGNARHEAGRDGGRTTMMDAKSSELRKRLDQLLIERGVFASRARARAAILDGLVSVDGKPATKPAQTVGEHAAIDVAPQAHLYVSRAALKLAHGLTSFAIDPSGLNCLDVGASTGGFTQVLLQRGAKHVTAIDVGHDQLVAELAADPRVTSIEGLNAKDLTAEHMAGPLDLIVCDVSFISLTKALPAALVLAAPGAHLVALIKPQFEVGLGKVGKGGIVREKALHAETCDAISAWLSSIPGWHVLGITDSPIKGGDGNTEFLIAARHD